MLHDYAQQCEILVHSFISLQHAAQAATAGPSLRDLPGTMLGVKPRPCFHFSLSLWHASRRRAARAGSWACALRSHWHRCNLGGHDPARQVSLLLRAHQMLLDEYRELVSFCQQRGGMPPLAAWTRPRTRPIVACSGLTVCLMFARKLSQQDMFVAFRISTKCV